MCWYNWSLFCTPEINTTTANQLYSLKNKASMIGLSLPFCLEMCDCLRVGALCQSWCQLAHQVRWHRRMPSQPTVDTGREEINLSSVTPLRYLEAVFYSNIIYSALNDSPAVNMGHPPLSLLNLSSVSLNKQEDETAFLLLEAHTQSCWMKNFPLAKPSPPSLSPSPARAFPLFSQAGYRFSSQLTSHF